MFKSKNILILIITLFLFSCKDKAQTNNIHKTTNQKEVNFDNILKCSDYTYDNGYFFTADYGCIYSPTGINNYGNVAIYLVPKKKINISDNKINQENIRVNKLSINDIKKEFKIYLFLIDKKFLNYNKSADPIYYQKTKYEEKAFTFDENQIKWILIDTIKILDKQQEQNEEKWVEGIINRTNENKKEVSSLEKWEGIYLNSDNSELSTYQEIKDRIGWYEIKITQNEIKYINDTRMESEFPSEAPGGYSINYDCDYNISGNKLKLYEKNESDTSPSKNVSGNGQKLILELTKKENKYYGESVYIDAAENLTNSAREKSKRPYLFYKFDITTTH